MDVGSRVFGRRRGSIVVSVCSRSASIAIARVATAVVFFLLLATHGAGIASAEEAPEVGGIPQSVLRAKIPLRENLSRVHHPVSTASAAAQDFYGQGLTYYDTYGWIEATRSFNAALTHDPRLAMAWLGLARSYIELGNYQPDEDDDSAGTLARETLRKARQLRGTIRSPSELALFDLLAERIEGVPFYRLDDDVKAAYRRKIADAVSSHPRDAELLFLQAMHVPSESRGDRLEAVLAVAPDHVGAHHELVHHYEMVEGKVDLAVAHGNLLARLAPGIAHGRHMYGHNLGRVGRMPEALAQFEAADGIELALAASEGISVEYDWHHQHNLIYLLRSSYHQRNLDRVEEVIPRLRRQATLMPQQPPWGLLPVIDYYVAREDWSGATPHLDALAGAEDGAARYVVALVRGLQLISDGQVADAARRSESAKREYAEGGDSGSDHARFYADLHAALLDVAKGDDGGLEALIDETADDSGPYSWNDAHLRLDMMAALLMRMERVSLVEKIAATLDDHDPGYAGVGEWRARVAEARRSEPDTDRK